MTSRADIDARRRAQFDLENRHRRLLLAEPDPERRRALYAQAYAEWSREFGGEEVGPEKPDYYGRMMDRWVRGRVVLELGCGAGRSLERFAGIARLAIGADVDPVSLGRVGRRLGERASLVLFDGGRLPLGPASVDVVYSSNVLEHLHPEDARTQLREAHRVLRPGGRLVCITPPRWNGPHDVSKFFVEPGGDARGLHLKEYTLAEARDLLVEAGFVRIRQPWIAPSRLLRWGLIGLYPLFQRPVGLSLALERSPARRSGFLTGLLCLDMICLAARKGPVRRNDG